MNSPLKIQPYWGKVFLLNRMLQKLQDDEWIAWIDDDIVINDFSDKITQFDRVIASAQKETCIIVTRDIRGIDRIMPFYPNTGIVIVRKSPWCMKVTEYWQQGAQNEKLSTQSQKTTLHEQEYLTQLFYSKKNIVFEGQSLAIASALSFVEPRNHSWNLNTFKRFGHKSSEGERSYEDDIFSPLEVAAMPNDAYVHHTGMLPLYRLALIAHTLWLINDNYPLVSPR